MEKEYKTLYVNGYTYDILSEVTRQSNSLICKPTNSESLNYAYRFLDSIISKANYAIYPESVAKKWDKFCEEFNNKKLYRTGLAFIKTTGRLEDGSAVIGLWPSYIKDDNTIHFEYDNVKKDT